MAAGAVFYPEGKTRRGLGTRQAGAAGQDRGAAAGFPGDGGRRRLQRSDGS